MLTRRRRRQAVRRELMIAVALTTMATGGAVWAGGTWLPALGLAAAGALCTGVVVWMMQRAGWGMISLGAWLVVMTIGAILFRELDGLALGWVMGTAGGANLGDALYLRHALAEDIDDH